MSNYITRPTGHDPTYQGPYTASGVNLRLYVLPAPFAKLVALLDRYLNSVAGAGTYFPLGGRIVACFAAMGKVEGAAPNLGWMREIDVALFIPTVRLDQLVPRIAFFAPYLFVDVPQAAATGREVHGYRKDIGTSFSAVDTFADAWIPRASDLTHVDAWAVAAPGSRLRRERLIDLTAPAAGGAPVPWANQGAALDTLFDHMVGSVADVAAPLGPAFNLAGAALNAMLEPLLRNAFKAIVAGVSADVPIVFLRQFRDPRHSAQADIQQVVHAKTRLDLASLSGHQLPGPYQLTFHDMASHPFSSELGVPNGAPVATSLTVEANCGFVLNEAV